MIEQKEKQNRPQLNVAQFCFLSKLSFICYLRRTAPWCGVDVISHIKDAMIVASLVDISKKLYVLIKPWP
jgi:hypothetical protein